MQIFAKRTKKKAAPAGPRTVHKSDPVVEELLKKDPSEWNAKERRMVKRYQQRKEKESTEKPTTSEAETVESEEPEKVEDTKPENTDGDEKTQEKDSDSSDNSSSSSEDDDDDESQQGGKSESDSDSDSDSDNDNDKAKEQQSATATEEKPETPEAAGEKPADDDGKVPKDHEIWSVLDKLNSKQKRTLSRKLDRLGMTVLEEVEQEANNILDVTMPVAVETPVESKRPSPETTTEESKKKRRKKAVDWSSLTPEERLRREDQRRKQQEAAERRARGEDIKPGHKRPLNSARRRANRRKPKWEKKAPSDRPDIGDYKQQHHSSGFVHRKNRKQHQQQAASGW